MFKIHKNDKLYNLSFENKYKNVSTYFYEYISSFNTYKDAKIYLKKYYSNIILDDYVGSSLIHTYCYKYSIKTILLKTKLEYIFNFLKYYINNFL